MVARKEICLEEDIVAEAEAAGYYVRKIIYAGRRGAPDRWFKRADTEWILIEFKRRGEDPNGQQQKEHDRLRGVGQRVHIVRTHEEARRILNL